MLTKLTSNVIYVSMKKSVEPQRDFKIGPRREKRNLPLLLSNIVDLVDVKALVRNEKTQLDTGLALKWSKNTPSLIATLPYFLEISMSERRA